MNKRIIALLAAAVMTGALTGCGDGSDEGSPSGTSAATSANTAKTTESQTAAEKTTAAVTTKLTAEASGISMKTTAATTEAATQPAGNSSYFKGKAMDQLLAVPAGEIISSSGSFDINVDAGPGTYALKNIKELPGVVLFFEDHACDDLCKTRSLDMATQNKLKERFASSSAPINKINIESGGFEDFSVGMRYKECTSYIGAFPTAPSDGGESMVGSPVATSYYYRSGMGKAVVGLHFNVFDEFGELVMGGYIQEPDGPDVSPQNMAKYDPKIERITLYPTMEGSVPATMSDSSHIPDIKDGGHTYTYGPENLGDERLDTCWCEGKDGTGVGEYVKMNIMGGKQYRFITIYNGLMTDNASYFKNGRVTKLKVTLDGFGVNYILPTDTYSQYPRALRLNVNGGTECIFTIAEAVRGEKYDDTCISEIVFD